MRSASKLRQGNAVTCGVSGTPLCQISANGADYGALQQGKSVSTHGAAVQAVYASKQSPGSNTGTGQPGLTTKLEQLIAADQLQHYQQPLQAVLNRLDAVSSKEPAKVHAGCVVLDFCAPHSHGTPLDVAQSLRTVMGDEHASATLTYHHANGRLEVLRWTAGSTEIVRIDVPLEVKGWELSAVYLDDDGRVVVAVSRGEKDRRLVQAKFDSHEVAEDLDDMAMALRQLALEDVQLPIQELPGGLVIRARVDGKHMMQHILPAIMEWLPDGGYCADISEAVHGWNACTQLQLTWDGIILDCYELTAAEIVSLKDEITEIKAELGC